MVHCCFRQGCEYEALYICLCLSCETYSCEFHLKIHLSLQYRSHAFDSILEEPCEWTTDTILIFLEKEKSKKEELMNIIIKDSSNEYFYEEDRLLSDLEQINGLIEKVSIFWEQNIISNLLKAQHDSINEEIPENSELYNSVQLYCRLSQLRLKTNQILNKAKNDEETEQEFRRTCIFYQNYASDPLLRQALQEYINAYKSISSLYLIDELNKGSYLFIYDAYNEREEIMPFQSPAQLQYFNKIAQLPNNNLFYYGKRNDDTVFCIIDKDYKLKQHFIKRIHNISAIYFNRSIYCFGEVDTTSYTLITFRFDLDENRWIELIYVPIWGQYLSTIIFNNDILLSGNFASIFLYSVELNSFTEICYNGCLNFKKILINSKERVYVIERGTNLSIFESEIENVYVWKRIGKSIIYDHSKQYYYLYNKGGIYLAFITKINRREYFKFDFAKHALVEMACYYQHAALRKLEDKLEVINCYGQNSKLAPRHAENLFNKRYSIGYLVYMLSEIERLNKEIKINPNETYFYIEKGKNLFNLDRYLEAVECYNKAIKLDPAKWDAYSEKGDALHYMGKNLEAIECYDQALRLD